MQQFGTKSPEQNPELFFPVSERESPRKMVPDLDPAGTELIRAIAAELAPRGLAIVPTVMSMEQFSAYRHAVLAHIQSVAPSDRARRWDQNRFGWHVPEYEKAAARYAAVVAASPSVKRRLRWDRAASSARTMSAYNGTNVWVAVGPRRVVC